MSLTHNFQAVTLDNIVKAVVAHAVLIAELILVHLPQFAAANAAVLLTDTPDKLHTESLLGQFAQVCVTMLIVGLG